VRDPRFGRTSELPSEDPYLAGHYGAGMVRGFQQRDARGHVKALSYLKHYTMYSDQNQAQPGNVSMHDLHESYLRQYRIAFQQGGCSSRDSPPAPLPRGAQCAATTRSTASARAATRTS
jgi:beta-glucosidase-like glycosyl hydrolase